MPDREKVIEGLKKVWNAFNNMEHELYADYVFDALELLKEQEPTTPELMQDAVGIWNICPRCGHILKSALYDPLTENNMFFHYPNYCEACGQAVKWE